jgi:hypothetical protein
MEILKVFFMKDRFLDIMSQTKLFVLERSTFILFKKYLKIYLNLFIQKVGAFLTLSFFYHQGKL